MMLCQTTSFFLIIVHLLLLEKTSSKSNQKFPEAPSRNWGSHSVGFFQSIELIPANHFSIKLNNLGSLFSQAFSFLSAWKYISYILKLKKKNNSKNTHLFCLYSYYDIVFTQCHFMQGKHIFCLKMWQGKEPVTLLSKCKCVFHWISLR